MIYLDNNATTTVAPEVFEAMKPFLTEHFGNRSFEHSMGRGGRSTIDSARESVAGLLGASDPGEILFTSGGTESNNWAILGALESQPEKRHIITTRVEHEAVREVCEGQERDGFSVTWLDVDEKGRVDLDEIKAALRPDTAVFSMMLANNETGVIFPVAEAAKIVKANSDALFHSDAANAAGKIEIDVKNSQIDLLSISGHKFHAPKGIGALYIRDGVRLPAWMIGGGQENGRRASTEAADQIVGIGAAADLVKDLSKMVDVGSLRDKIENEILQKIPNSRLNGGPDRLPNTSNISFENTNGEMIVHRLSEIGICVSTGSACNGADHKASAVLQAMNVPYLQAMGSIRFSFGRYNTAAEVDQLLEKLPEIVENLHAMAV